MDRENIMSQFWAILFLVLFIIICFLLVVVVLLQKGRGGGLGAAFGGAGSSAFGTRTGDVFTWITIVLTALFLLLAVSATVLVRPPMRNASDPVFTPTAEPIEEATAVQIRCYTPRVKIYYTLDGRDGQSHRRQRRDQPQQRGGGKVPAQDGGDGTREPACHTQFQTGQLPGQWRRHARDACQDPGHHGRGEIRNSSCCDR
jgi:protein translocase SecG subunit